jgi:hypothetical protein
MAIFLERLDLGFGRSRNFNGVIAIAVEIILAE